MRACPIGKDLCDAPIAAEQEVPWLQQFRLFGALKGQTKNTSCHNSCVRDDGKSVEVEPTTDTRKDRVPPRISRVFLVELFISYRG